MEQTYLVSLFNSDVDEDCSINLDRKVESQYLILSKNIKNKHEKTDRNKILNDKDIYKEIDTINKYYRLFKKGKINEIISENQKCVEKKKKDFVNEIKNYDLETKLKKKKHLIPVNVKNYDYNEKNDFSYTKDFDKEADKLNKFYNNNDNIPNKAFFDELNIVKNNLKTYSDEKTGNFISIFSSLLGKKIFSYKNTNNFFKCCLMSFLCSILFFYLFQYNIDSSKFFKFLKAFSVKKVSFDKHFYDKITNSTNFIIKKQDFLESNYDSLVNELKNKIDTLQGQLYILNSSIVNKDSNTNESNLLSKIHEIQYEIMNPNFFKKLIDNNDNFEYFTNKTLNKLNFNNEFFSKIIIKEIHNSISNFVPAYIKNRKLHFTPEFHKYLYKFVENFLQERNESFSYNNHHDRFFNMTDNFKIHNVNFQKYLNDYFNEKFKNIDKLSIDHVENIIKQRLNENNEIFIEKFDILIDNLNFFANNRTQYSDFSNLDFEKKMNRFLLDELIELFSIGTIKINYANYNLGSRILGFLTSKNLHSFTSSKEKNGSSLINGISALKFFFFPIRFLGDNFDRLIIKSPDNFKYNANNALLDNGHDWNCESNYCSIGIRLSNLIIPTEIIIKNIENNNNKKFSNPTKISVYINPKSLGSKIEVLNYLNKLKIIESNVFTSPLKKKGYLKNFIRLKTFNCSNKNNICLIKMPTTSINLKIPVKDIYIEFSSPEKTFVSINEIKIYGVTEFTAHKFTNDFNNIIESLKKKKELDEDNNSIENDINYQNIVTLGNDLDYT